MRYIDINQAKKLAKESAQFSALKDWDEIERDHIDALKALDKQGRSAYFKSHTDWNKWIPVLAAISHEKCWYTEAPANSTHWDLEHFRPKNRAKYGVNKTDVLEDGYWWLAYNVENFRLAGSIVNLLRKDEFSNRDVVLGKGNYFPLDTSHCNPCQPHQNHRQELPLLLDPTLFKDTTLITFDADGTLIAANPKSDYEREKIKMSEKYLGLNHTQIKTQRKKIWDACFEQIKKAEEYHGYLFNPANEQELNNIYDNLRKMGQPSSIYSSVVKACMKFYSKLYSGRFAFLEEILESI